MVLKEWTLEKEEPVSDLGHGKKVTERTFINPYTGRKEKYSILIQGDCAMVFAMIKDPNTKEDLVITIKEFKQGANEIVQSLPGGTVDSCKESPEKTAKKELLEETGYESKKMIPLGPPFWLSTKHSPVKVFPFLALNCRKKQEIKTDENEIIETELVPLEKWIEMTGTEINEIGSVATTLRALLYLRLPS